MLAAPRCRMSARGKKCLKRPDDVPVWAAVCGFAAGVDDAARSGHLAALQIAIGQGIVDVQTQTPVWQVIVVGAGAAGLLAGIFAARQGAKVLLVDTRRSPGAKIRVSGGGRCNIMPSIAALEDFETRGSAKTMRNMLGSWPRQDVQRFFEEDLQLPLVVEKTGKMFPASSQSRDVVTALLRGLQEAGAQLRGETRVTAIAAVPTEAGGGYRLKLAEGEPLYCERLVVATGGLSMPKTGSDGAGWRMLQRLGHSLHTTAPALVPLCGAPFAGAPLAGLALPARLRVLRAGKLVAEAKGDFLFTHRGYSGPVVLDVSRHWTLAEQALPTVPAGVATDAVQIVASWGEVGQQADPERFWSDALASAGRHSAQHVLRAHLPRRLADTLLAHVGLDVAGDNRAVELGKQQRRALLNALCAMPLPVDASEGYKVAEVTCGGVPLAEVVTSTLESRKAPGVYLCGETLDVTGRLGGFNFLWAWVTGRRAGEAAARSAGAAAVAA